MSGIPGTPGLMAYKNWKECAWKNLNDEKDQGLIKVREFPFHNGKICNAKVR